MTTTLRDFIANREVEIRDLMKALRIELRELQTVKNALDAQDDTGQALAIGPSGATIKDLVRNVLSDASNGMTSGEILAVIRGVHGRDIDRTSLSPQLSRLKADEEVVLNGDRWFLKPLHDVWQQKQILEVFGSDGFDATKYEPVYEPDDGGL